MKKNNNNHKQMSKQNKRFLIFILAFLSIFIITIPVYYGVMYAQNKVTPFVEETTKLKNDGYNIIEIKSKDFKEFGFELVCKDFDITKNYRATYTAKVDIKDKQVSNIKMQVALTANWIKFNNKSNVIDLRHSDYNQSTSVYDIKPLVEKTNKLLPLPVATTYVLLTYDRGPSGNKTKNAYLIEYTYGTYVVEKGGYQA